MQCGRMAFYAVAVTAAMILLAMLVGRLLRWPRRTVDALVLSVAFLNSGNFGLSVILFSFGEAGLQLATVFFVVTNLACNTLGAFFAARANGGGLRAVTRVLKLPGLYAFVLAFALRALGVTAPQALLKPVETIGRASVPIMLMMLGVQLSQTKLGERFGQVAIGVIMRLIVGAGVALGMALLLGLTGLAQQVAVIQASTPTAVSSALMAIEFDADADYVSSVIFATTVLSSVSLTFLMMLLG